MTTHIGSKQVVHFSSLIVPDGEAATIEFNIGAWNLNFNVSFSKDESVEGASLSIEEMNGKSYMKFANWTGTLGTATQKPFVIGKTNQGHELSIMITHWLVGDVNKVDIQFMIG